MTERARRMTERQWTIVVGIGRERRTNGPALNEPALNDYWWEAFRFDVDLVLRDRGVEIFFAGAGTGVYPGVRREESATWVGATSVRPDEVLHAQLGELARRYDRDSIAVTYGDTVFVEPAGTVEV